MEIKKGLWYLCAKSHSYFTKGYWYYCPEDNHLNGNNNKPSFVYGFRRRHFVKAQEIKIKRYEG